ncbi:MAG: serine acetyltransferase [Deltaproteobacteria bacterium]|nr:serine acetyltransferase [Deltaproteobacteria bacterium]
MTTPKKDYSTCRIEAGDYSDFRKKLPGLINAALSGCAADRCYLNIDFEPVPSTADVIGLFEIIREVLFPGFFTQEKIDPVNINYHIGRRISELFDSLSDQISRSIRYECFKYDQACTECDIRGYEMALAFIESIPSIQDILDTDVQAMFNGDPAAKSHDEIIFCYPGIAAITAHRIAHELHRLGVPLIPRMMSEYAHRITGIDIHPGATIGKSFVIDHGTGVVIGETSEIGENVRLYQGVTIGALSVPQDHCDEMRGEKRHPTIGDNVVVYSGASILGGDTVIGAGSVIGGNVWITESVPPDTTVIIETPSLVYKKNRGNGQL